MAGKVNKKLIQKQIFENKSVKKTVIEIVEKEVFKQKELFQKEFISHPVTQELEGGENASNNSGTLGGYGNLFSFLGFNKGANLIPPVQALIQSITLEKNIKAITNGFRLRILIPTKEEFAAVTRLPWESGRSWLLDIERGISGLGAYLYGRFESSRSGRAIQSKYNYANRTFRPVKYFGQIYSNFLKRLGAK